MKNKIYCILVFAFGLIACEHKAIDQKIEPKTDLNKKIKEFTYSEKSITINKGDTLNSVLPLFSSESPVSFIIKTKPESNGNITIDEKGIVRANTSLATGFYTIDVEVSNLGGTSIFANAYTINVINPEVSIRFTTDILPLVSSKCSSCHTSGSSSYKIYANFKNVIDESIRRVELTTTDEEFMPKKRANQALMPLSKVEIDLLKKWKSDGLLE